MKKVVIVTRRMIMGGIEKSLISYAIESMPKQKYDVTLLVMGNGGELIGEIPNHVKVKCLYGNEKSTFEKL